MKLAFYYHIPITIDENRLRLPGHFGLFIDELASNVDELILLMHEGTENESMYNDHVLGANNIKLINLGHTSPAWHRALFHSKFLSPHIEVLNKCDRVIVRMPCAFAPFFYNYIKDKNKLWYMVVGDYSQGAKYWPTNSIRNIAIKYYLNFNHWLFEKNITRYNLLVNSVGLFDKYYGRCRQLFIIKTTTIRQSDFYEKYFSLNPIESINLLYVGRIDAAKGLYELLKAVHILHVKGKEIKLKIVGWELDTTNKLTKDLIALAETLDITTCVKFVGKLNIGAQLNAEYRWANFLVLPTYYEGFPRVIWEAMANSLPVITTSVGGISKVLEHQKNAYFIEPKQPNQIADALEYLIKNPTITRNIIKNGYELVKENTLENQTKRLIELIR